MQLLAQVSINISRFMPQMRDPSVDSLKLVSFSASNAKNYFEWFTTFYAKFRSFFVFKIRYIPFYCIDVPRENVQLLRYLTMNIQAIILSCVTLIVLCSCMYLVRSSARRFSCFETESLLVALRVEVLFQLIRSVLR